LTQCIYFIRFSKSA